MNLIGIEALRGEVEVEEKIVSHLGREIVVGNGNNRRERKREWKSFRTNWRATLLETWTGMQVLRLIESTHDSQPARYHIIAFANMVGNRKMTSDQGHRN